MFFLSLKQLVGNSSVSLDDVQKGPPAVTIDELSLIIAKALDSVAPLQEGALDQIAELQKQLEALYTTPPPTGGVVVAVTATDPVLSSEGIAPDISLAAGYGDTQNPYADKTANYVLAGPVSGVAAAPAFRALVAADIPALSYGTVTSVAALTLGTTGTDLSSTVANSTTTPVITLQVPTASATNRGALSSADWTIFNGKQPAGTYVTAVSVVSANGLAGTSSGGATPALTLSTSITGILKGDGTAISAAVANTDYAGISAPLTKTADFTVTNGQTWFINNKSGSTCVVTLPAAASWPGRPITIKNLQAQLVNSATSNVAPIDSATAGTAILLPVIGNWATMVSDGTSWVIMQQAPNNILLLE